MPNTWTKRKSQRSQRAARRRVVILASRFIAFVSLGVSVLLISLYLLFPVGEVQVEGNQMLPDSAILDDIPERASLPLIRAGNLQSKLKDNPWVKDIGVDKNWKSGKVVVEVNERDAALNASLAGGERVVLAEDGTRLPGLGEVTLKQIRVDRVRLGKIQGVQETLESNGVEVESVKSVGSEGVEVSINRPGPSEALALFSGEIGGGQARVLKGLLGERPDAGYFDLRTPGRVIVGQSPPQKPRNLRGGASDNGSA